jgi:cytochrome b561
MPLKSTPDRYGSVAIVIHWVSALALVLLYVVGRMTDDAEGAAKVGLLQVHIVLGVSVLVLTLLRIVWWAAADKRPGPPAGQPGWQRMAARITHLGLYAVILVMAASGIATLALSGAIPALMAGAALPDFGGLLPRRVHGLVANLVVALVVIHTAAALYHQFVRKDRLLARMGIGAP